MSAVMNKIESLANPPAQATGTGASAGKAAVAEAAPAARPRAHRRRRAPATCARWAATVLAAGAGHRLPGAGLADRAQPAASGFPTPLVTLTEAVKLFSDPFYSKGPNDQGIGWNVLASLQRVAHRLRPGGRWSAFRWAS